MVSLPYQPPSATAFQGASGGLGHRHFCFRLPQLPSAKRFRQIFGTWLLTFAGRLRIGPEVYRSGSRVRYYKKHLSRITCSGCLNMSFQ